MAVNLHDDLVFDSTEQMGTEQGVSNRNLKSDEHRNTLLHQVISIGSHFWLDVCLIYMDRIMNHDECALRQNCIIRISGYYIEKSLKPLIVL